jgi:hypothetical protein
MGHNFQMVALINQIKLNSCQNCAISRADNPQPSTVTMNQEDEDAFLYGEPEGAAAAGPVSAPPPAEDHEMEPASEEGEVDEEDEEDSVRSCSWTSS